MLTYELEGSVHQNEQTETGLKPKLLARLTLRLVQLLATVLHERYGHLGLLFIGYGDPCDA